jgi:hypothetical protein
MSESDLAQEYATELKTTTLAADKRRRDAAEAQRLRDERMTIGRRKFIERETMIIDAMANDKTDK